MDDLLQYMAIDIDEQTRKAALSLKGFCCDDELTTMREVTNLANWRIKPLPRYMRETPKTETTGA